MSILFAPPYQNAIDSNGVPISGGKLRFYESGTLTPATVYTSSALSSTHPVPVVADSAGRYPAIYLDPDVSYRVREFDASDVLIRDTDPISDTFRATLAGSGGAALVGVTGGSNVQASLNSLDGRLDAVETFIPAGEASALALSSAVLPVAQGPRDVIVYNSATSVRVSRRFAHMGGFRFHGQYTKGRAPVFPMPSSRVASVSTGLGAESAVRTENWYAVFACADNGASEAVLKVMPYLRAGTPSGSNIPLIKAGENVHALTSQTYAWSSANNLNGTECLVIAQAGNWSGRVTTITANSASQITLADATGVTAYDFLLPAPPGYDHFVYLGSFYFDTAEIRNIYDSGMQVGAKMIFIDAPTAYKTGARSGPPGDKIECGGYICPLATSILLDSSCVISTASTGDFVEYFDPDGGSHITTTAASFKASTSNQTLYNYGIHVNFLYPQHFYYYNDGTMAASRINGQLNIVGWVEP